MEEDLTKIYKLAHLAIPGKSGKGALTKTERKKRSTKKKKLPREKP